VNPRPCTPTEAVGRALQLLADSSNATTGYLLGAGDYHVTLPDSMPWSPDENGNGWGADCRVAFLWCYRVPASRPGYNHGSWATVSDCVNYNSMIEDAGHACDLMLPLLPGEAPQPGDILCYPTIYLPGHPQPWIGHGAIVLDVSQWDGQAFHTLTIMQVKGPDGRTPAAVRTDGSVFDQHSITWPKPEHCSRLLRVQQP
jgi:hypothetical protein